MWEDARYRTFLDFSLDVRVLSAESLSGVNLNRLLFRCIDSEQYGAISNREQGSPNGKAPHKRRGGKRGDDGGRPAAGVVNVTH